METKPISNQLAREVIAEYKYLKERGKEIFDNQEGIDSLSLMILKLFSCSLGSNNETCTDIFLNLKEYFPSSIDGILGDIMAFIISFSITPVLPFPKDSLYQTFRRWIAGRTISPNKRPSSPQFLTSW